MQYKVSKFAEEGALNNLAFVDKNLSQQVYVITFISRHKMLTKQFSKTTAIS